jgi:hypothetical protein
MALAALIDNFVGGKGISYMVGINAWIPAVLIVGAAIETFTKRRDNTAV